MGQRSQIYVRATLENGETELLARYFQWNYGERMISCARWSMEAIQNRMDDDYWCDSCEKEKMARFLDVNFDMRDIRMSTDIIDEFHEWSKGSSFKDYVFLEQDNNDGKLFIDVDVEKKTIKYAFLDNNASLDYIMDGKQYMAWNTAYSHDKKKQAEKDWRAMLEKYGAGGSEAVLTCEDNIKEISAMATLMTREELENFLSFDYEKDKTKTKAKANIERE